MFFASEFFLSTINKISKKYSSGQVILFERLVEMIGFL